MNKGVDELPHDSQFNDNTLFKKRVVNQLEVSLEHYSLITNFLSPESLS